MAVAQLFRCRHCHADAGRVTLYARGELVPARVANAGDTVMSDFGNSSAGQPRLEVRSQVGDVTIMQLDVLRALAALGSGDARALHALGVELVPFWCPGCDASYCGRHWITWDLFHDGFFDEKRGRCPAGHERRLLD